MSSRTSQIQLRAREVTEATREMEGYWPYEAAKERQGEKEKDRAPPRVLLEVGLRGEEGGGDSRDIWSAVAIRGAIFSFFLSQATSAK